MSKEIECRHDNFVIRGNDSCDFGYCPDCDRTVRLWVLFNNLADRMREEIRKAKEATI